MKKFLYLAAVILLGATLDARPASHAASHSTSHSVSRPSSHSYGTSKSYSRPSVTAPASRPASPPKVWGSSTTFTKDSKKAWGSSTATVTPMRTAAEVGINRGLNQAGGDISRAAAVADRDDIIARERAGVASASTATNPVNPPAVAPAPVYNANVDYVTARSYRHYYSVQPAIWPQDIPLFLLFGGVRRHIIWDPFYHSYGWYAPDRRWVYYDSVAATVPGVGVGQTIAVVNSHPGPSWGSFLLLLVFGLIVIAVIIWFVWRVIPPKQPVAPTVAPPPVPQSRASYRSPEKVIQGDLAGLTKGSRIKLSDPISMADARTLSPAASGLFATVESLLLVRERNDLCTWTFLYCTSEFENQEILLKIKDAGGQRSMVCYTRDVEGTRQALVDSDDCFLFSAPVDEKNFNPMDLRYAKEFTRKLDGERDDKFALIHPSELHGSAVSRPDAGGEVLATVAEWRNVERSTNEYLAVETGNGSASEVETWWGDRVGEDEIDFYITT